MARFLFVIPPATGHVNPTISVGRALTARGHTVAWVGYAHHARRTLPDDAELLPLDDAVEPERLAAMRDRSLNLRGAAAFKFLWEDIFLPLARSMRPGVEAVVERWRPDVLVVDEQTLAGALVARRAGLPWASLCTTSASVAGSLATLPMVKAWLDGHLADLQREAGLEPSPTGLLSPQRVIVFSTRALVGPDAERSRAYRFVGPSISDRPETTPFPWEALRAEAPKVLVSLGTVNAERGARFYREVLAAATDAPFQLVLSAPAELVGPAPDNVIVRGYVPQLSLLPRMDAVVCHGGHNTVAEALAQGLPLVVAPIKDDQPVVADQVVAAGAGVRVKFGRVRAPALRAAIDQALGDPALRAGAARIRDSFAAAGGAETAAELLEELVP